MTYKIQQIEGIGPYYAERLTAARVFTTSDLLRRGKTPEGRQALEQATGIPASQLLTWTHQADLMRVSGIGSEYGQLLEASGIDDVSQLADRKPENLMFLMAMINEQRRLTRALPALKTVNKWVERARHLEPVLVH